METIDFCKIIATEIDNSGLSVSEVARRAGFDKKTVWNWYNGFRSPSIENAQCILSVFGKEIKVAESENEIFRTKAEAKMKELKGEK